MVKMTRKIPKISGKHKQLQLVSGKNDNSSVANANLSIANQHQFPKNRFGFNKTNEIGENCLCFCEVFSIYPIFSCITAYFPMY